MRAFLMLYVSYGKSMSSEHHAFTVLSSVCLNWRLTLTGWPDSPTGQSVRRRLLRLIQRECVLRIPV